MRRADLRTRLLATFRSEAEEHLGVASQCLLAMERDPGGAQAGELVEQVFRAMHTLKGAARSVSLAEVEAVCQGCESALSDVVKGRSPLTPVLFERLHRGVRDISEAVARGAQGPATGPDPVPPTPALHTIRIAADKLDALLVQADDLLAPKLAAAERVREAEGIAAAVAQCRATRDPRGREAALRALAGQVRDLRVRLTRDYRALESGVDGIRSEAKRLRLSPFSRVLDAFPGMVRDLAVAAGKQVEWVVHGADLELDRKVLEAVKDPLLHVIRNALDHGIEPPLERTRKGKSAAGRVSVTVASWEGLRVAVTVDDDGRGIDTARVRAAAVRSRLLSADAADALAEEDALKLVYRSGLSTTPMVTDVSGHGLGLAIARDSVERIGGHIEVTSRPGRGTTVSMVLPAHVATFRGLLVAEGGHLFLLPAPSVARVMRIRPRDVMMVEGRETLRANGEVLLLTHLSAVLGVSPPAPGVALSVVLLDVAGDRLALHVGEIRGECEVLVKEIATPLQRVRHIAAAGLLGTGELALILRPADLLRWTPASSPRAEATALGVERATAVLVVDDSITTRAMERNLLEAAGYNVQVAVDGVEAWTVLKTGTFDVVVSDVDMPRMDGFELTQRIRSDPALAEVPVVLVTALEAREDKEKGIAAGANAYVVKSSFDQSNLLEIIRRLT